MGVMTGSEKGTYYQFGLNLQALGKSNGINLSVYPSKGSVENIYAVYQRPGVQVGIVQSDVLAFVAKVQTDQTLQRIAKKIKMVFPLYNEEVHLLARKGIASFDDLAGKRVAIGREGSGTYLTVRLLFKVSEVAQREMVLIDTDGALAELRAGRIDAMFFVAGYPVRLLAEGVAAADNLVLVPITNKDIAEFYPSVTIPANTYAWQPEPVQTVAVKAVLVSFDYRRGAIAPPIVERHEDRLDRDGLDGLGLPGVRVGGDRDGRVELGDVLVGDRDEHEIVRRGDAFGEEPHRIPGDEEHRVDPPCPELRQRPIGVDQHHLTRRDLRHLEEQPHGEVGPAALPPDRHPLPGEIVEGGDALPRQ